MPVSRLSRTASASARLLAAMALLAAVVPAVGAPRTALAANFVVNLAADPGDGTCDATCTLRDAIQNANTLPGHDTITFSAAISTPIVLGSALPLIAQPLTIDGSGQAITVDGANAYRPFLATSPITLTALTIQRGRGANGGFGGGGAYFGSTGVLSDVTVINNISLAAVFGAGGAYFASSATIWGGRFISNTATAGGGAYAHAARWFAASQTWLHTLGAVLDPSDQQVVDRYLAVTRSQLPSAQFEAAWAAGLALAHSGAVAAVSEALSL